MSTDEKAKYLGEIDRLKTKTKEVEDKIIRLQNDRIAALKTFLIKLQKVWPHLTEQERSNLKLTYKLDCSATEVNPKDFRISYEDSLIDLPLEAWNAFLHCIITHIEESEMLPLIFERDEAQEKLTEAHRKWTLLSGEK